MLAYELLATSTNWCQGSLARDSAQTRCNVNATTASQWDALGAIIKCYNQRQDQTEIRFRLAYYLRRTDQLPPNHTIGGLKSCTDAINKWNDAASTTHNDILEALVTLGI